MRPTSMWSWKVIFNNWAIITRCHSKKNSFKMNPKLSEIGLEVLPRVFPWTEPLCTQRSKTSLSFTDVFMRPIRIGMNVAQGRMFFLTDTDRRMAWKEPAINPVKEKKTKTQSSKAHDQFNPVAQNGDALSGNERPLRSAKPKSSERRP